MAFLGELRVKATLENVGTISRYVHAVGQSLHLSEDTLFDIDLAVEEASVNIIKHAYPAPASGDILLHIEATPDAVSITLTDWGIPIDAAKAQIASLTTPAAQTHTQDGKGLRLIHALMDSVMRTTAAEPGLPNTLRLCKRIN